MSSHQISSKSSQKRNTTSTLSPGSHLYCSFYACYLLRSYYNGKVNQRTYIGSTPNPPRRIRQHNGQLKGGAHRTKSFRPWEMELICYGFPSKLIALQFEWVWNTPYKSRHLQFQQPSSNQSISTINQTKKVPIFPKTLGNRLEIKLKILKKMLTTLPWSQYPLKVLFFDESAYQTWFSIDKTSKNLKNSLDNQPSLINARQPDQTYSIQVSFRPEGVDGLRKQRRGIPLSSLDQTKPIEVCDSEAVLEDYEKMEEIRQRSNGQLKCFLCQDDIDIEESLLYAVCFSSICFMSAHLLCLSKHFLNGAPHPTSQSSSPPRRVLPDRGFCPACSIDLRWGELIKGCYRRKTGKVTEDCSSQAEDDSPGFDGEDPNEPKDWSTDDNSSNQDPGFSDPTIGDQHWSNSKQITKQSEFNKSCNAKDKSLTKPIHHNNKKLQINHPKPSAKLAHPKSTLSKSSTAHHTKKRVQAKLSSPSFSDDELLPQSICRKPRTKRTTKNAVQDGEDEPEQDFLQLLEGLEVSD
ncbi:hypothetical protein O181_009960 [Austropuccinia psidii MF-1]|uniref:GIY-YIG domain-containing protein n=1 Tax=Austropuccinia psidii MF-1 TaxID=1389203 RepID=A0A9Q3GKE9_9BASI|nr:hypothetical protein [Austropuccinia psidii MF-1]